MLLKFLSNTPFLFLGGFVLIFAKFFSMMNEEPKNIKHANAIVTKIIDPNNSSSYRAIVEFQLETGQKARAIMLGLCSIADANEGDQIEIDYFLSKNGNYYASSNDPRYMTVEKREANEKARKVCIFISAFFTVLYVVLTILEFVR